MVFTGSVAASERIYSRRREATELYRAMHPLVMPLDAITRGSLLGVGETLRPFFRDISDHLKLAHPTAIQAGLRRRVAPHQLRHAHAIDMSGTQP